MRLKPARSTFAGESKTKPGPAVMRWSKGTMCAFMWRRARSRVRGSALCSSSVTWARSGKAGAVAVAIDMFAAVLASVLSSVLLVALIVVLLPALLSVLALALAFVRLRAARTLRR